MNICMCLYKHMHVSSVACVLNMIINGPLSMIAYLCLTVSKSGPPPMYVQAVLVDTASECSMAFWLRASRTCKIYKQQCSLLSCTDAGPGARACF